MTDALGVLSLFHPQWINAPYLFGGLLMCAIACWIFALDHRSTLNVSFTLNFGLLGIFVIFVYLYLAIGGPGVASNVGREGALYWGLYRMAKVTSTLQRASIYLFTVSTLGIAAQRRSWIAANWIFAAILALLFMAAPRELIEINIKHGLLHHGINDVFSFYTYGVIVHGIARYSAALFKASSSSERAKFRLLLIGISIYLIVTLASYFPAFRSVFGSSAYFAFAVGQIAWTMIGAYLIVRYRLLDIHSLALKSSVWLVASLLVFAPLSILLFRLQPWFTGLENDPGVFTATMVVLFFAGFVYWTKLQSWIDVLFQRRKYDLERLLARYLSELASLKSLDDVSAQLRGMLVDHLFAGSMALYIRNEAERCYASVLTYDEGDVPSRTTSIALNEPRLRALSDKDKVVPWSDLPGGFFRILSDPAYLVPLNDQTGLLGFIVIGRKMGEEDFSALEVEFLNHVRKGIAIALSNAMLFDQVKQFGEQMEAKVEERTRDLAVANYELKELNTIKTEMVSIVSHELRNPVAAMKNSVYAINEILAEQTLKEESTVRELIATIRQQLDHVTNIINNLLDFSRQEIRLSLAPVDLKGLLQQARESLQIPSNSELQLNGSEHVPAAMIDAQKIRQVFINLAQNALDAMPKGGVLSIRTLIEGMADDPNSRVSIEFQDTGEGISVENLPKLFKPHFTTKVRGTGVGLAICWRIVKAHGGTIEVESELGKGSTFKVKLPFAGPPKAPSA